MGTDRFVYWKKRKPSKKDVLHLLEDYLGEVATGIEWGGGRYTVTLFGHPTTPFRRIKGALKDLIRLYENQPERFFEVYLDPKYADIITRQADEFTSVVAEGFARVLERWYEARREHD